MKISTHMKITELMYGIEGREIHEWIDALFDKKRFEEYLETGILGDFNPYDHRKHRHCREAADEAVHALKHLYSEDTIRMVFELHVRGDYSGYFPSRSDFGKKDFEEKYHSK